MTQQNNADEVWAKKQLERPLQESICTALVFISDADTRAMAKAVETEWFEVPYREIVSRALGYWRDYNEAAGEAHVDDLFADVMKEGHSQKRVYESTLHNMFAILSQINTAFVRKHLSAF